TQLSGARAARGGRALGALPVPVVLWTGRAPRSRDRHTNILRQGSAPQTGLVSLDDRASAFGGTGRGARRIRQPLFSAGRVLAALPHRQAALRILHAVPFQESREGP